MPSLRSANWPVPDRAGPQWSHANSGPAALPPATDRVPTQVSPSARRGRGRRPTTQVLGMQEALLVLPGRLVAPTDIVLIDGRSGSGKSTLAARLVELMEQSRRPVRLFSLEDAYPGWDGLACGARAIAENLVVPLAGGRPGSWERYDWRLGAVSGRHLVEPGVPTIVEGVGALHPVGARLASCCVWMETSDGRRRARALRRDGAGYAPHWQRWAAQEADWIARHHPLDQAELLIDNDSAQSGPP